MLLRLNLYLQLLVNYSGAMAPPSVISGKTWHHIVLTGLNLSHWLSSCAQWLHSGLDKHCLTLSHPSDQTSVFQFHVCRNFVISVFQSILMPPQVFFSFVEKWYNWKCVHSVLFSVCLSQCLQALSQNQIEVWGSASVYFYATTTCHQSPKCSNPTLSDSP